MNRKILFVIVPTFPYAKFISPGENEIYDVTKNGKKTRMFVGGIPIGVLSISSYVKKYSENTEIKIIDFNLIINGLVKNSEIDKYNSFRELYVDIMEQYSNYKPDIVAISAIFNSSFECIQECAEIIRKKFEETRIIVGGGLATNAYKMLLANIPTIDAACVGEGEVPFANLAKSDDIDEALEKQEAFFTRNKMENNILVNANFVKNLDDIPPFDYGLISFDEYAEDSHYGNVMSKNKISRVLNICSTRGCPHKCTFCCSHSVHGRTIRYHSAERIIADIQFAINRLKIDTITFNDDNFLYDRERALCILKYLSDKNLNVTFPNGFTIYRIDDEISEALSAAGVKEAALALESGNQNTLDNIIKKPLKLEMVKPAIESLRKAGLYVRGFFMIGFPGETKESIKDSIDYLCQLEFNWVMVYTVTPFLGSEIYEICKENNYLLKNSELQLFYECTIETPDFDASYISREAYLTNLKVNFVNNYDMKVGNYELALMRFEKIISQAKDHAVAYYCAAFCANKLGDIEKGSAYKTEILRIVEKSDLWNDYIKDLKLDINSI